MEPLSYYVLGCFGPADQDRAGIGDILNTEVPWQTGRRFETPPPTPVEVTLNPEFPGIMVPMFDSGILLLSDPMLAAIRSAGVDNLDTYDAVIRDPATGKSYTNYKAVNIIGVVACADLSKSTYRAPSGSALVDTDFDSLAIDEKKTGGALMFRLAECVTAIVIHAKVRKALESKGIEYLDYYDPKDWVG
jgi:hypothetical protein